MRAIILLLSSVLLGSIVWATDQGQVKRPLDLPSGGQGADEDEEDEPESITFYGSEFEGDGFFWCLDHSGSMGSGGGVGSSGIATLRDEMTSSIQQLSRYAEFSMVKFSTGNVAWSENPRKGTPANKASAIVWVQAIQAVGWTCLAPAGVKTLEIANRCSKRRVSVLILGDGMPNCNGVDTSAQCLSDITAANYKRLPVHTLFISVSTSGTAFFQSLAAMNGGTFTQVQ